MPKRRVGTISMAIVLIGFGILIFISQISKSSALEWGIKFWPAILLLLGGEILYYSYKYKDENVNIKYDILSIFIVLLIVGMNLILYSIVEIGVIDRIYAAATSQNFNYQTSLKEVEIGDDIKKIVINPRNQSGLTIRTGEGNKIISTCSVNITTDSEESAKSYLDEEYIKVDKAGDIAYITFAGRSSYNDGLYGVNPYGFELILPADKEVEIIKANELELILDNIGSDWIIDDVSYAKVRLGENIDLKINAFIDNAENLGGNAKWNITEGNGEDGSNIRGQLIYGEGTYTINILNSYEVEVYGIHP
ncbi:MAG: hypothetical protein GX069_01105 [Tissierellia bacterium]|nr:hypothetical protein [Tissierellia bacterium]